MQRTPTNAARLEDASLVIALKSDYIISVGIPNRMDQKQALFRDEHGKVKNLISVFEGITYRDSPLDFFILLARYKFAARLLRKSDACLDAGCGHGLGSVFLSKFATSVVGGEIDSALVDANKKEYSGMGNLAFRQLNLLDVSGWSEFDAVVSMDVIEHFTKEQTEIVAANYARLVKPGGFAVIGTPNRASAHWASQRRLESHLHEFDPQEFEELLSRHFGRVFLFSMTDEIVSTSFKPLAWYLMALCVK